MICQPFGRALLVGLALLSPVSVARAADAGPTVPSDEKITQLIAQLGADNFDAREEAMQTLAGLGRKAVKALETGTKSDDMEIVRRCTELLDKANRSELEVALDAFLEKKDEKLLLQVPAWTKFQKVAGDTAAARNLFVLMCTSDGLLLTAMEQDVNKASQLYNQRCQQLQQRMFGGFGGRGPQPVNDGEMAPCCTSAWTPASRSTRTCATS